jgi:hypothetical protein
MCQIDTLLLVIHCLPYLVILVQRILGFWKNEPALGIIFTHANLILYKAAREEMRRCETGATLWPWNETSLPIDLPGNIA